MHLRSESGNVVSTLLEQRELCVRVLSEYREMPGMSLTLAQAARLFNLDRSRCAVVLHTLVDCGVLTTNGSAFARADVGRRGA